MGELPFHVVDVFTDRAFEGNPLAVVLDADDLSQEALQAIAREFNLSETAFPMRPSADERDAGADYRLRIFTPEAELPFAGHPSVGAAWVLASLGRVGGTTVRQACGAGVLALDVRGDRIELSGGTPSVGGEVDAALALSACGLGQRALGRPPRLAGAGLDFAFLLVDEPEMAGLSPDLARIRQLAAQSGAAGLCVVAWNADEPTAHARVFAGDLGVPEDPATGSAALGLAALLVAEGLLAAEGESAFTVRQGAEIGRPSRIECRVAAAGGEPVQCWVAGTVAPVSTGRIRSPVG